MDLQELFGGPSDTALPLSRLMNRTNLDLLYDDVKNLLNQSFGNYTLNVIMAAFHSLRLSIMSNAQLYFQTILRWTDLYIAIQYRAIRFNNHLRIQYHSTIPEVFAHMIEFLQCKVVINQNYYTILVIQIELLFKFAKHAINYRIEDIRLNAVMRLWNVVLNCGDYNFQYRAVKLMSIFLQNTDFRRYTHVFQGLSPKNTNIILTNIQKVIYETDHKSKFGFVKAVRGFLNKFNMVLNYNNSTVFSVHCQSVRFARNLQFLRPKSQEFFWIDFNFETCSISFTAEHQINTTGLQYLLNIVIKIIAIKMHNCTLIVYYVKPDVTPFQKNAYNDLGECNKAVIFLELQQYQRLVRNRRLLECFNCEEVDAIDMEIDAILTDVVDIAEITDVADVADVATGDNDEIPLADQDGRFDGGDVDMMVSDMDPNVPSTSTQIFQQMNEQMNANANCLPQSGCIYCQIFRNEKPASGRSKKMAERSGNADMEDEPISITIDNSNARSAKAKRRARIAKKIDLARK